MRASRLLPALLLALLLAACNRGEQPPRGDTAAPAAPGGVTRATPADSTCVAAPITDSAAGPLRLGMHMDEARRACPGLRDTTVLADEGMTQRVAIVVLGRDRADTVEASIVRDRVWRLAVTTPGVRTVDSLGVGTPLATLLALPAPRGLVGEGRTFVVADTPCGLSFQLSANVPGGAADSAMLARLPAGTVVKRVLVTGCG